MGSAWLGDSTKGGKTVKLLKGWEFDGSNPDLEDKILNTILEKNMTGDKPREVVRKPGVADDAWSRRRDTSFDGMAKIKMKRAMYLQGRTTEKGPKWSEEYELAKKVGAPKDILIGLKNMMSEEAKQYPVKEPPKGFKEAWERWRTEKQKTQEFINEAINLNDSIDQTLVELDNEPTAITPTSKDMVGLMERIGDPTQVRNPQYRRVAQLKEQAETQIKVETNRYLQTLIKGVGWLKDSPEKTKEFMKHLHKVVDENGKVFVSTDPDILAAEKWHRMVMDDLAERFDLKKKGLYVNEYATINYDMNKIWDYFKKPLVEATDYASLPDSVVSKLDTKHFYQLQELAKKYPKWDDMPREEQGRVQMNYLKWGAGSSEWAYLPQDLKDIVPEKMWASMFQKRTAGDRLKFALNEDYFDVTGKYIQTILRTGITNDFFLPKANAIARTLPFADVNGSVRNMIDRYIKGPDHTSYIDNKWKAFANRTNAWLGTNKIPMFAPKEATDLYTEMLYRGAMGPDTGMRKIVKNLYTLADVGGKNFFRGFLNYADARWMDKAKRADYEAFKEHLDLTREWFDVDMKKYFGKDLSGYEKFKQVNHKITQYALSPMMWADNFNKGIAYFAGLEEAAGKGKDFKTAHLVGLQKSSGVIPNLEYSEAQQYAWNKMTLDQFQYGVTHTSPMLTGRGMRLLTPFWSFPIKTYQLLSNGLRESVISQDYARMARFIGLTGFLTATMALPASVFVGINPKAIWHPFLAPMTITPVWYNFMHDAWIAGGLNSDDFMTKELAKKRVEQATLMLAIPQGRWLGSIGALKAAGISDQRGPIQNIQDGMVKYGKTENPLITTNMFRELGSMFRLEAPTTGAAKELIREERQIGSEYNYKKSEATHKIVDMYQEHKFVEANRALQLARKAGYDIQGHDMQMEMGRRQADAYMLQAKKMPKAIRGPYMQKALEMKKKNLEQSPGTKSQWVRPREEGEGEE
jgi:hypothetical protein